VGCADLQLACSRIILYLNKSAYGALHRVPGIVHQKVIPITPSPHIELPYAGGVVMPKRLVGQQVSNLIVACGAEAIFDDVEE
jgi:hypothetical protein